MFSRLEVRQANHLDALDFAGEKAFLRRVLHFMVRKNPALLVSYKGFPLALVLFHGQRCRRIEFVMAIKPQAARVMPALVRLAHLTLCRFAHDGKLVLAHIRETDTRAHRMARLVGFEQGKFQDRSIWLFKRGPK